MSLIEDTNPRELKGLLGQIHEGEMALPDFQRDFVWNPEMTEELLVSVARSYPAGSFLRIRDTTDLFPCREFQGAPELRPGARPTYLLLDGQQRLTSLYQALHGKGDVRYYLLIGDLIKGNDITDCLFHLEVVTKKAREYEDPEVQARELILPLGTLTHEATSGYTKWSQVVARKATTLDERNAIEDRLRVIGDSWIKAIEGYKFPVVTLAGTTPPEAVCKIFETVNSTGIQLSPFELLSARYFARGVNIRELWREATLSYPSLSDFNIDPYYALQVIALLVRTKPSCRVSDILELDADIVRDNWGRVIRGLALAIDIVQNDCGVIQAKWLPSKPMLLPIAATLGRNGVPTTPQAGAYRHKLVQWFWCSVFGQTYESSTDSQVAKDTFQLHTWLEGGERPKSIQSFHFDPRMLRSVSSRRASLYRGVIALILSRKPRDFHTGAPLTNSLMIEKRVDDHHVFPRGFLKKQRIAPRLYDCVLNRTLIDHATNAEIADRAPAVYLQDIQQALGETQYQALMQSHLLPSMPRSPLLRNAFKEFLSWRQDAVWQAIQQVTGAEAPADLVTEEVAAEAAEAAVDTSGL